MSIKVNRREFLRFSGGGVAGLAAAGVTMKGISTLNAALDAEEVKPDSVLKLMDAVGVGVVDEGR